MKRYFPVLIGLCLLLVGVTVCDNLSVLEYDALTVYTRAGVTVYEPTDTPPSTRGQYVRADLTGDPAETLARLSAKELRREELDGVTVIYAFSPRIAAYETLSFGRVNVMLAVRPDGRLAVGSPLLKGSY